MKIGISGYAGRPDSNKNYEVPKVMLDKGWEFLKEDALGILRINEISGVIVGSENGSDVLGLRLAEEKNVSALVKKVQWDKFATGAEAHASKTAELVEASDVFVLFRNNASIGGKALIECLEAKPRMKILIYDFSSGEYVITKGKNLGSLSFSAEVKKTDSKIDYVKIAKKLLNNGCVMLDTETTGLDSSAEVIDVCLVNGLTGHVYFSSKIKTESNSSIVALSIHGITDEERKDSPTLAEVWPSIEPLVKSMSVVAHNASYDYRMLEQSLERYGLELPVVAFVDSVPLFRAKFGSRSVKLEKVCQAYGIEAGTHTAESDTIALASAFRKLAEDEDILEDTD